MGPGFGRVKIISAPVLVVSRIRPEARPGRRPSIMPLFEDLEGIFRDTGNLPAS